MVQLCNNLNERAVRACFIERAAKGNHIQNAKQPTNPLNEIMGKSAGRLSFSNSRGIAHWHSHRKEGWSEVGLMEGLGQAL